MYICINKINNKMETQEIRIVENGYYYWQGVIIKIDRETLTEYSKGFKSYDDLQPIPLTEEILLKCGFEKRFGKYGYYFVNIELSGFRIWAHDDQHKWVIGKKNFKTGDTFVIKEISKYLHDIQNIYFALTEKELEINL